MHSIKKFATVAALSASATAVAADNSATKRGNIASRMRGMRGEEAGGSDEPGAVPTTQKAHGRGGDNYNAGNAEPVPERKGHAGSSHGRDGDYETLDNTAPPSANAHHKKNQNKDVEVEDVMPGQEENQQVAQQEEKTEQQKPAAPKLKERAKPDYICPMCRRVMEHPVRAYLPLKQRADGTWAKAREFHRYEKSWISRWIKEHGVDFLDRKAKLTLEDLEDDEEMKDHIQTWAVNNNHKFDIPPVHTPEETEFMDVQEGLKQQAGNEQEAALAIMDHTGVQKIEYNAVKDFDPEIAAGVSASLVKDLVEVAALPGLMEKENPDLSDQQDDRNGYEYSINDIKSIVAGMKRYKRAAANTQEIVHEDHKGTGKTQRAIHMYVQGKSEMTIAMMGHSSALEWRYDLQKDGDHFVAKGGSGEEGNAGNMDTPVVGDDKEEENAKQKGRLEGVEVHSHYWGEYKHLKFAGEFTAQGGKQDAGGLRHTLVETWKQHREYHHNAGRGWVPLKVTVTGHGSGGSLAEFFILDSAKDNEVLPFMKEEGDEHLACMKNPTMTCNTVQCLVEQGEIEFSLVQFGSPRVTNEVGKEIIEKALTGPRGLRAARIEMVFDPVPHMAGPKKEMKEDHAQLFKPVGKAVYLAPAFGEGKALNNAKEFLELMKTKEQAVVEVQGIHALETYSLAIKGGSSADKDFMFTMANGAHHPNWALTQSLATDHASKFMKWIDMHIYDDKDHLGRMMRGKGSNMFSKMSDMFGGNGGNGGMQDMMKNMMGGNGGSNPLGNLGNLFGGNGGNGLGDLMKNFGGGKGGPGGIDFDQMMGGGKHPEF